MSKHQGNRHDNSQKNRNRPVNTTTNHGQDYPQANGTDNDTTHSNKPQKINADVNIVDDKKWTRADKITAISLFISILMTGLTYSLFKETQSANKITTTALAHQITKDSFDNVVRMRKDINDSIIKVKADAAESAKIGRDTIFINKQKAGIDAQISAIKETQKEFSIENRPFIVVTGPVTDNPVLNKPVTYEAHIINSGKQPAKIISLYYDIFPDTSSNFNSMNNITYRPEAINEIIVNSTYIPIYGTTNVMNEATIDTLKKIKCYVYFRGRIIYSAFTTKEIYYTYFLIRVEVNQGQYAKIVFYKSD